MEADKIHNYLMHQHRNIYQEAQLFEQNRKDVSTYLNALSDPFHPDEPLRIEGNSLVSDKGNSFPVRNNVIDFREGGAAKSNLDAQWNELNKTLINYQKYLTPYVLLNSLSVYSYIGEKTGLNVLKNARVVDVGAGTGQIYGTFFFHQESIDYYLVDPNLRLLHDHFLRLYPKLVHYPLSHLLCYAEHLPFVSGSVDLVMSISSIDHFKDYRQFIAESARILRSGGQILIASHLDGPSTKPDRVPTPAELQVNNEPRSIKHKVYNRLNLKFERYAAKFHGKKRGTVPDDHMHHFENTDVLAEALRDGGFVVEQAEVFNHNFFIKARKS